MPTVDRRASLGGWKLNVPPKCAVRSICLLCPTCEVQTFVRPRRGPFLLLEGADSGLGGVRCASQGGPLLCPATRKENMQQERSTPRAHPLITSTHKCDPCRRHHSSPRWRKPSSSYRTRTQGTRSQPWQTYHDARVPLELSFVAELGGIRPPPKKN